MNDGTDLLEVLQEDVAAVLAATPSLSGATVLADNQGDIENLTLRALGTRTESNGKMGLVVIVLLPEVMDTEANLPGPQVLVEVKVQVIEQVLVNRDETSGTGIRSSQAALRVLAALHLLNLGKQILYSDKQAVKPVPVKTGYVSHAVTLRAKDPSLAGALKTAALGVTLDTSNSTMGSPSHAVIILDCATEGATIYYTADGTYPSPATAEVYVAETGIEMPEVGTVVRAAAFAPGHNPSDVLEFVVT